MHLEDERGRCRKAGRGTQGSGQPARSLCSGTVGWGCGCLPCCVLNFTLGAPGWRHDGHEHEYVGDNKHECVLEGFRYMCLRWISQMPTGRSGGNPMLRSFLRKPRQCPVQFLLTKDLDLSILEGEERWQTCLRVPGFS